MVRHLLDLRRRALSVPEAEVLDRPAYGGRGASKPSRRKASDSVSVSAPDPIGSRAAGSVDVNRRVRPACRSLHGGVGLRDDLDPVAFLAEAGDDPG